MPVFPNLIERQILRLNTGLGILAFLSALGITMNVGPRGSFSLEFLLVEAGLPLGVLNVSSMSEPRLLVIHAYSMIFCHTVQP